jgi:hypothetical protein
VTHHRCPYDVEAVVRARRTTIACLLRRDVPHRDQAQLKIRKTSLEPGPASVAGSTAGLCNSGLHIATVPPRYRYRDQNTGHLHPADRRDKSAPLFRILDHVAEKTDRQPAWLVFDDIDHRQQGASMVRMRGTERIRQPGRGWNSRVTPPAGQQFSSAGQTLACCDPDSSSHVVKKRRVTAAFTSFIGSAPCLLPAAPLPAGKYFFEKNFLRCGFFPEMCYPHFVYFKTSLYQQKKVQPAVPLGRGRDRP